MLPKLARKVLVVQLLALASVTKLYSQTTAFSFTSIPVSSADINAPGRGVEQWHDRNDVNVPAEGTNTPRLDVYYRFVWTLIEGPTLGSYTWDYFDNLMNLAISNKQKISFGIMTVYPGGTTQNGLVSYDGGNSSYPLYLHSMMQAETVKDWRTGSTWTPNYNSANYQNRLLALNQAIDAHIKTTSFNGVPYRNVIGCIDIRGYGAWGEWHSGYTPNNVISDYPAGTFPTIASLKKIVDAHTQGFPDFQLVAMIAAFDAQALQNTWNPPEIAHYMLTQRNNLGLIGWRRDQWGATDSYLASYLENNIRSFAGLVFKDSIMVRWKSTPITGEPPGWNPNSFSDLERQVKLYHAASFGNGNYGVTPTTTIKNNVRAASKACGYRLILESGSLTLNGNNLTIALNWKNIGLAPTYENWDVVFELKNGSTTAWTGVSQFKPKLFQPLATATLVTDNFTSVPAGTYNLSLVIKDPTGYRAPLPLAINGRNTDGSYAVASQVTVQSSVPTPTVSVTNNCGSTVLTSSGYTGTLLWSTGESSPSITVTNAGTYTVTQTVSGSTSAPGTGVAAPKLIPSAPAVTVNDNCGYSVLNTSGSNLSWSTGETGSSITVITAGTYTVTQTAGGCTGAPGNVIASPKTIPLAPAVTVTNNCGNATLEATGTTGTLLWSNGATTTPVTVTTAAAYTVTQTVSGCTSPPASAVAAPKVIPLPPSVSVTNDCESSLLTASGSAGSFTWNTGETTESITVHTAGLYSATQTDITNGCTSPASSKSAAPKTIPAPPAVTVTNHCGYSVLTATGTNLHWSTGETTVSITVTTSGTYTVTQTVNGCESAAAGKEAAPFNSAVDPPTISVVNNCGNAVLTADGFTGSLLWSNGATTASVTVTTAGTYSVIQKINGCSSAAVSEAAAPLSTPAPVVTVVNNCGNSVLSASGVDLVWSTGETTASITVTNNATYTVTQTLNNCASAPGSGTSAPKLIPSAPAVTVANHCGYSVLSATGTNLHWSTGETTASITVTTTGTYTVTQTVNGCESAAAGKEAAPFNSAVDPPTISVVNNCGNAVLTADGFTGELLWSNGATTASITVTNAGIYSVIQKINGCSSAAVSEVAAPLSTPAPVVTVVNNCGNSVLSTSGVDLVWSTGETTASITVTNNATYTVTQTLNNCTSAPGSGTSAPKLIPSAPAVTVNDNCGYSVLNTSGSNLSWSTGETGSSITVITAGTYTVTQTAGGCTGAPGNVIASPKTIPLAPAVTVTNNCGNAALEATGTTGTLLWSNGATTTPVTVTTAAAYTVTQTVSGCTSPPASAVAAPKVIPLPPSVSVTNDCESSLLTASGSAGSFTWNTGETTESITVHTAGLYSATQTDITNGCTSPASSKSAAPKTIPAPPAVTVTNHCGYSVLTATGTNLHWSTGETTVSITVTTSGTYTVTQTVNGCESAAAGKEAAPFNSAVDPPTISVVNNCGNAVLTADGFTGSLLWSNGATTASVTVTTAGTYSVIQKINGCSSAAVSEAAAPLSTPAPVVTVVNNCGNSVLSASGVDLVWSTGETTASITVTNNATYTVTQTLNNCASAPGSGTSAPKLIPSAPAVTVANHCGYSVLSATGTNLHWSTGETTASITVTTTGTYTVTQTVNGCESAAAGKEAAPFNSAVDPPIISVVNNCGNAVLTADGFTGELLWSNGATTASITVTAAGTYSVIQKINGCSSAAVSEAAAPLSTPAPVVSVVNNCGNSVLTASAFTGSLLWSNGATTTSIMVTTAGTYTVRQTLSGCTSAAGSGVAAPATIPSAPGVTVLNSCGSSILTATGVTGTLLWSNGSTAASITVSNAAVYTVTQSINGCTSAAGSGTAAPMGTVAAPIVSVVNNCGNSILTASGFTGSLLWSNGATTASITVTTGGTYTVTQTINGCTSVAGNGVAAPLIAVAPVVTVANNCGNSVLTASAFTGSLLWSNGATTASITVTTAATYTVRQTVGGCTSAAGSGVAAPRIVPSAPGVTVVNSCGSSLLTATGVTGTLLWSNGSTAASITVSTAATYTVTQTANGCTSAAGSGTAAPTGTVAVPIVSVVNNCGNSVLTASGFTGSLLWSNGATTSSITVTTAGTFTVTQTLNGCTSAAGSAVAAPVITPSPVVTISNNCGNSVLTASVFTGSLLWSNGATTTSITVTTAATYTVSQTVNGCTSAARSGVATPKTIPSTPAVTVVNSCNSSLLTATGVTGNLLWNNGATTTSITVTTAATYAVTQTVSACTSASGNGTAAPTSGTIAAPIVSVVNNCGSSVLTATGTTGALLWSNGATTTSITVTTAATYTVTQTVNGCTSAAGSGVATPKTTPVAPTVAVANNCGNSVITASAFTGSLLWSNEATTTSITVTTAGTYTVRQTLSGCTSAAGSGVAAPKTIPSTPGVTVVNSCGSSLLTATGVTGTLLWSNGSTAASITVGTAGTHTVTQTVNGCTSAAGSGTAAPATGTVATPLVSVVNNCGNSVLTATGTTGTLLWSNGATTTSITVATAATYTVRQTVSGCTSTAGSGVAAPRVAPSAPGVTVVNSCGSSVLTATGVTGTLLWSNGATASSITVSTAATYTVTQTANGCTSAAGSGTAAPTGTVAVPIVAVVNNCGSSVLTASGFTGTLLWSNGATTSSITVTTAATYTVRQTVGGCTSAAGSGAAAPKTTPVAPTVTVGNNCGNSILTASAFTGSLLWSNGATTTSITVTTAATYTVTQTVNGCTSAPRSATTIPKTMPVLSSSLTVTAFSGKVTTYVPTSVTSGTTFSWSRAAVTGISNATASGTGNINESLVNTTTSAKTVTYIYTITANGCINTQNVVVTVNPPATTNCLINASLVSSFNSTSIPSGRYIWFNSALSRGSLSGVTGTVTLLVTNSKITFTANSVQYTLNVPSSRIRYDAAVSSATTQFVNNIWEITVPRTYAGNIFMGGLAYLVPVSLPGNIANITWTANISIDKPGISLTWQWAAAAYTSFAAHAGLNIKPKDGTSQNPYANNDNAGTPENFKSSVVSGAKGTGGTNYTGTSSSTSTATCSGTTGTRPSAEPVITQQSINEVVPALAIELPVPGKFDAFVAPNPSNNFFNVVIKGNNAALSKIKVLDVSGRVVEVYEKISSNTALRVGERLASGYYIIEVIQNNEKKNIRVLKFD